MRIDHTRNGGKSIDDDQRDGRLDDDQLDEFEELKTSLMHQAFNGEL